MKTGRRNEQEALASGEPQRSSRTKVRADYHSVLFNLQHEIFSGKPSHVAALGLLKFPGSDNGQSVNFVELGVAGLLTTHTRASAVLAHEGLRARGVGQKTPSSTLIRVRLCDTFGRNVSAGPVCWALLTGVPAQRASRASRPSCHTTRWRVWPAP